MQQRQQQQLIRCVALLFMGSIFRLVWSLFSDLTALFLLSLLFLYMDLCTRILFSILFSSCCCCCCCCCRPYSYSECLFQSSLQHTDHREEYEDRVQVSRSVRFVSPFFFSFTHWCIHINNRNGCVEEGGNKEKKFFFYYYFSIYRIVRVKDLLEGHAIFPRSESTLKTKIILMRIIIWTSCVWSTDWWTIKGEIWFGDRSGTEDFAFWFATPSRTA